MGSMGLLCISSGSNKPTIMVVRGSRGYSSGSVELPILVVQGVTIAKHAGGSNVKAHVLVTEDEEEVRIILVKKDETESASIDVTIKGEKQGRVGRRGGRVGDKGRPGAQSDRRWVIRPRRYLRTRHPEPASRPLHYGLLPGHHTGGAARGPLRAAERGAGYERGGSGIPRE